MLWWAIPLHQYKWHLDTTQKIHPRDKQSAHTILLNLTVEQIGTYENLWYKTLTLQVGRRRQMLKHVTFQWWRHQVFNLTKENTDKKAWAKESKKTGKIYISIFSKVSECQGEANGYGKYIIPCALKLWLAPSVNPNPKGLSTHSPTQVCLAIHCINTEAKAIHNPIPPQQQCNNNNMQSIRTWETQMVKEEKCTSWICKIPSSSAWTWNYHNSLSSALSISQQA
jgi:hypothetical protein